MPPPFQNPGSAPIEGGGTETRHACGDESKQVIKFAWPKRRLAYSITVIILAFYYF